MRLPLAFLMLVVSACGDEVVADTSVEDVAGDDLCAHVIDGEIEPDQDGTYTVSATVASADTGLEKFADAWEIRSADRDVLGVRELLHPHVDEQPFTRSLRGVEIPDDVEKVTLTARDSVEGFCGETFEIEVP